MLVVVNTMLGVQRKEKSLPRLARRRQYAGGGGGEAGCRDTEKTGYHDAGGAGGHDIGGGWGARAPLTLKGWCW